MRLIDLNKIPHKAFLGDRDDLVDALLTAPTVDAVPVVFCRECKYYNKPRIGFCEMHLVRTNGSDFCSYGERKGGDE